VVAIPGGWLARVQYLLFAYSSSGSLLWSKTQPYAYLLAPAIGGYYLITQGTRNSFGMRFRAEPRS
jgi:hypothetical protein